MKTLKRWIKNIRWLLNLPNQTTGEEEFTCDFCGNQAGCWKYGDSFTICNGCMKTAFTNVLLRPDDELSANIIGPCAVQALKYLEDVVPKTTKRKPPTMKKAKKTK